MRFRENNELLQFMERVAQCSGEVYFISAEGDRLNLKSTLSKYLFATICGDRAFLERGNVECSDAGDYNTLREFLREDTQ